MKIDEERKSPASGPLQGTAGQEGLKYFLVTQTATGRCIRGGGVHRNFKRGTSLLNIQIYPFFIENAQYQGEHQDRSFTR
jgi:hypothetical protein